MDLNALNWMNLEQQMSSSFHVEHKILPQVEESLYLEILFLSEGIMEQEINRGISGVPTDFS